MNSFSKEKLLKFLAVAALTFILISAFNNPVGVLDGILKCLF